MTVDNGSQDVGPRILVYHPTKAKALSAHVTEHGIESVWTAHNLREAVAFWGQFQVLLGWDIPPRLLQSPGLRWVQMTGAGVDQMFQVPGALPPELLVTRVVDQFGVHIAEYVFAYVLYLTKQIQELRRAQLQTAWEPLQLGTLAGKTIGVAGLGSIGREVVRKARAFDMRIYGLSRTGEHADLVDRHFMAQGWTEFVRDLDVLVLALPLTTHTRAVVSDSVLAAMRAACILVNIGRGQLIDEMALVRALEGNHLRGAVLDVFATEPLPPSHPFWSMSNVYVTPHLSGPSESQRVAAFFVANLHRYRQDQPLLGAVDLTRAY